MLRNRLFALETTNFIGTENFIRTKYFLGVLEPHRKVYAVVSHIRELLVLLAHVRAVIARHVYLNSKPEDFL